MNAGAISPRWSVRPRPLLWRFVPVVAGLVAFHLWNSQELFLLFASGILATAAVSLAAGLWLGRRARVRAAWPETAHAGTAHAFSMRLSNSGPLPLPLSTVELSVPGTALPAQVAAPLVDSEEPAELDVELEFRRRGVFKFARVRTVCAPLGFFEVRREWDVPVNLVVHPKVWVLAERDLGPGSPFTALGMGNLPRPGHDVEFLGVREYATGDSPRLVHWPTTARRGKLFVKELARSSRADVTLFTDLASPGPWTDAVTEDLVTGAASIVHLFRDLHLRYQMLVNAVRPVHVRFGLGSAQYQHAMHVLTQVARGGDRKASELLGLLVPTLARPNALIVMAAFPTAGLLDLLCGVHGQGVPVALLTPWLRNLPDGAIGAAPGWEPVGPGGRALPFRTHRYSSGEDLKAILAGLR